MEQSKRYIEFYKNYLTFSSNNFSVTTNPFFQSPAKNGDNFNENQIIDFHNYTQLMKEIINKFPLGLRILYCSLRTDQESNISGLTFFKLKDIEERFNNYKKFFDIGVIYAGMGHVIVLSFVPEVSKLFFRYDGGANGYEREENYNFYLNYNPIDEKDIEDDRYGFGLTIHKLFNFNKILYDLEPKCRSEIIEECIDNS